jgi:hypothetical protein
VLSVILEAIFFLTTSTQLPSTCTSRLGVEKGREWLDPGIRGRGSQVSLGQTSCDVFGQTLPSLTSEAFFFITMQVL